MRRGLIILGCLLIASLARSQGGETGGGGGSGGGGGPNLSTLSDDAGCIANDFVIRNPTDTLFDCTQLVPLAQLTDDNTNADRCLVSGGSGGIPNYKVCPGGTGGITEFTQIESSISGGNQVIISTAANASGWATMPPCNSESQTLGYDATAKVFTCLTDAGAGGGMTSFSVQGDEGSPPVTITDGNLLQILGGTGISTEDGDTGADTVTISLAPGEVGNDTWTDAQVQPIATITGTITPNQVDSNTGGDFGKCARFDETTGVLEAAGADCGTGGTLTGGDVQGPPTATVIQPNVVRGTMIALTGDTQGDVMYYNGTDWVRLPKGTPGQVLESTATNPAWATDDTGGGAATTCIWLDSADVTCPNTPTSSGCVGDTIDGTGHSFMTANFGTDSDGNNVVDSDSSGSWKFLVPTGWTGATLSIEVNWMSDHVNCNGSGLVNVCWNFDAASVAANAQWKAPSFTGSTNLGESAVCSTNGNRLVTTQAGFVHGMTDGQMGIFVLKRDYGNTSALCATTDDYVQPAKVLGVKLCKE